MKGVQSYSAGYSQLDTWFPVLLLFFPSMTAVRNAFTAEIIILSLKFSEYLNKVWKNGTVNTFYDATTTVFLQSCMT